MRNVRILLSLSSFWSRVEHGPDGEPGSEDTREKVLSMAPGRGADGPMCARDPAGTEGGLRALTKVQLTGLGLREFGRERKHTESHPPGTQTQLCNLEDSGMPGPVVDLSFTLCGHVRAEGRVEGLSKVTGHSSHGKSSLQLEILQSVFLAQSCKDDLLYTFPSMCPVLNPVTNCACAQLFPYKDTGQSRQLA